MKNLYGILADGFDGSASLFWFEDKELVDELLSADTALALEALSINEGVYSQVLTLPSETSWESIGIKHIQTREDCKEFLEDDEDTADKLYS